MRKILFTLSCVFLFIVHAIAGSKGSIYTTPGDTLKVVNWNLEWFGGSLGPDDDSLQQENVLKVMLNLNADVYALIEVVSVTRLQDVVRQMPGYDFLVADFCSGGSSANSCKSAQKLAFVYRTSKVTKIREYGVLRFGGSSNAYNNWSSGRFPYLMSADITLNGVTQRVEFISVHAKANLPDYIDSYNRRKAGAQELYDSIRFQYPTSNVIVLGDYNDDLMKTITTQMAPDTTTSWIAFKADQVNFAAVTLPLSLSGQRSTVSYPTVIDHVVISKDMNRYYVANSAKIFKTEVESWITSYGTTTSDHYPVQTKFVWSTTTPVTNVPVPETQTKLIVGAGELNVYITHVRYEKGKVQLLNMNGQVIQQQQVQLINGTSTLHLNTSQLSAGIYLVRLITNGKAETKKIYIYR